MDVSPSIWQAAEEMKHSRQSTASGLHSRYVPNSRVKPSQHDALEQQTRKWIAQSFFGPILKQMRQDPFHSDLFDGGQGGEAFNELYDQELTNHMTRGAGAKLVNSIVNRIEAKNAYAKHHLSKINQEREGADRFHPTPPGARSPIPVAPGSNDVPADF
ncbi:MAG: rod-binding protein [Tepidisphaeraceae bacterium]|jgi:Rod binding domain-containing protein